MGDGKQKATQQTYFWRNAEFAQQEKQCQEGSGGKKSRHQVLGIGQFKGKLREQDAENGVQRMIAVAEAKKIGFADKNGQFGAV